MNASFKPNSPEWAEELCRGLEESGRGEVHDLGSFAQYGDTDEAALAFDRWSPRLTDLSLKAPSYYEAFVAGRDSALAERDALRAQLDKVRDALNEYREHTLPGVWLAMRLADVAEWEATK